MNDAISPEEFEERLLTIRETAKRTEVQYQMHCLVVDLLVELGYEDGADIYAETVIER